MLTKKETHHIRDPPGSSPTVNVITEKGTVVGEVFAESLMQSVYEKQLLVLGTNRYRRSLKVASTF